MARRSAHLSLASGLKAHLSLARRTAHLSLASGLPRAQPEPQAHISLARRTAHLSLASGLQAHLSLARRTAHLSLASGLPELCTNKTKTKTRTPSNKRLVATGPSVTDKVLETSLALVRLALNTLQLGEREAKWKLVWE
jgi:hypothetical protein